MVCRYRSNCLVKVITLTDCTGDPLPENQKVFTGVGLATFAYVEGVPLSSRFVVALENMQLGNR